METVLNRGRRWPCWFVEFTTQRGTRPPPPAPSALYRRRHHCPSSEFLLRSLPELSLSIFINTAVVGATRTEEPYKAGRPSTQGTVCEQLVGHWERLCAEQVALLCVRQCATNASSCRSGCLACSPPDPSKLG